MPFIPRFSRLVTGRAGARAARKRGPLHPCRRTSTSRPSRLPAALLFEVGDAGLELRDLLRLGFVGVAEGAGLVLLVAQRGVAVAAGSREQEPEDGEFH